MSDDILVIDDCRVPKFEATVARTVPYAQELLLTRTWDEVWWDHDMGPELRMGAGKFLSDTRELGNWIEELFHTGQDIPSIGRCWIHTNNPVGGRWLLAALQPFYETDFRELRCTELSVDEALAQQRQELSDMGLMGREFDAELGEQGVVQGP